MDASRIGVNADVLARDLPGAFKTAGRLGFSALQLPVASGMIAGIPFADLGGTATRDIRHTVANLNIALSGGHADYPVRLHQTERLDALAERIREDIQACGGLMLPVLTTSIGALPEEGDARDAALDMLKGIGEAAQTAGVIVALSTGPSTADELAATLDTVAYGAVAANIDPGRLALRGEDSVAAVERLAGHISHVHLTDGIAGEGLVPPGRGDVDWAGFAAAIEAAGHGGALTIRVNPGPNSLQIAADALAFFKSL